MTTTIPSFPIIPHRLMSESDFANAGDDLLGRFPAFVAALNAFGPEMEGLANEAALSAENAQEQVSLAAEQKSLAQGFAEDASEQVVLAAAFAAAAVNAPGTSATSTTNLAVASGSVTMIVQPGKTFVTGQFVIIASTASPSNYMSGQISAYDAGTGMLTVNATQINGTGTFTAWTVAVIGAPGAGGATGDILITANNLEAPGYLPCNGAMYLKSSYPSLAGKLGPLGLFDNPIPIPSLPTGLTATGVIYATTWTPDGQYLVAAGSTLRAMKRSGDTLVNITLTSGTSNTAYGVVFDKVDGTYLGEAGANSPYIKFHKRTGDMFAALSNPASLPPGSCTLIDCSPDGVYWAVATIASPYLVLYKRTGDIFAKLTNPATMPGATLGGISFSPDGQYLAVATRTMSPYLWLYQRFGDVFTAVAFPGVMPTGGDIADVKFDPTGRYFAVRNANSYSRTAFVYDTTDNWSVLSVSVGAPSGSSSPNARMAWSSDGKYLIVPTEESFELRDVKNGFALLSTPPIGPGLTSAVTCAPSFSPDNMFLVFAGQSAMACLWKRRYDPTDLFATPRIVGVKAYIKT